MSLDVRWVGARYYTEGRQGCRVEAIVPHIVEGSLSSCDNTFASGSREGSAHYCVGGNEIHQYVSEADTAWAVGNWQGNLRTISIEHAGTTENPPTFDTIQTGAKLMADIASRLGWTELVLGQNVMLHRWYSDTSCPASLDYGQEIRLANQYLRGSMPSHPVIPHAIYRLFNPYNGQHMFTRSPDERDMLLIAGWKYEDVGWYEPDDGERVYRALNPHSGEHIFTTARDEVEELARYGWRDEGFAFYSDPQHARPVYRLYNGFDHMYTASHAEQKRLVSGGVWYSEGIAFYGAARG